MVLAAACGARTWKDVTFNYESTDTADFVPVATPLACEVQKHETDARHVFFLPDLTDEQIASQIEYCLGKGWSIGIEYTDDPHPRNVVLGDVEAAYVRCIGDAGSLAEIAELPEGLPEPLHQSKCERLVRAAAKRWLLSFIVNRPAREPGFRLDRQEVAGRGIRYTIHSYCGGRSRRASVWRQCPGNAGPADGGRGARPCANPRSRRCSRNWTRELIGLATREGAHPPDRRAAAGHRGCAASADYATEPPSLHMCFTGRPAPERPPWPCAWPRYSIGWGTCDAGIWCRRRATTWWGSTSGIPRQRPRRFCKRRSAACCSSTKPTISTARRTSAITDRRPSRSCCSSWRTGATTWWSSSPATRTGWTVFFQSNPGLHSRIAHHIDFPDYSLEELMAIAESMARQQMYAFDDSASAAFREYLATARQATALCERPQRTQCHGPHQAAAGHSAYSAREAGSRDELARIDAADIRASRVFQSGPEGAPANSR